MSGPGRILRSHAKAGLQVSAVISQFAVCANIIMPQPDDSSPALDAPSQIGPFPARSMTPQPGSTSADTVLPRHETADTTQADSQQEAGCSDVALRTRRSNGKSRKKKRQGGSRKKKQNAPTDSIMTTGLTASTDKDHVGDAASPHSTSTNPLPGMSTSHVSLAGSSSSSTTLPSDDIPVSLSNIQEDVCLITLP